MDKNEIIIQELLNRIGGLELHKATVVAELVELRNKYQELDTKLKEYQGTKE